MIQDNFGDEFKIKEGDFLQADGWKIGETLLDNSNGFKDSNFPGSQFKIILPCTKVGSAINLKVTGRKIRYNHPYRSSVRVRIEFVQDDNEPSEFTHGWLYSDNLLKF